MKLNLGKNNKFLIRLLVIAITYCTNVKAEKFCKWQGCVPIIVEKNWLGQMKIDKINKDHSDNIENNNVNEYGKEDIHKMLDECKVWKGFWPANCPIKLKKTEIDDHDLQAVWNKAEKDWLNKFGFNSSYMEEYLVKYSGTDNLYLWTDSLLAGLDQIKIQECSIPKLRYTDLESITDCAKNKQKWSASDYKFLDPDPINLKLFFGTRGFNFWETVDCNKKLRLVEKPLTIAKRAEAAKAFPFQDWIAQGTLVRSSEDKNWVVPTIGQKPNGGNYLISDFGYQSNLYISVSLKKAAFKRKESLPKICELGVLQNLNAQGLNRRSR